MLANIVVYLVDFSRRWKWPVVCLALFLALACGWFAATHFSLNTDVNQLLAADLPWRQQEKLFDRAFPQKADRLVIVVDGSTPEQADDAAGKLAEKLAAMPGQFRSVTRPDAIPFFRKNGLLFLPKDKLDETLEQLTEAQPMIGMLSSDPSLRGLMTTIGLMAQGFKFGQTDYARLDRPFAALAATINAALAGQDAPLQLDQLTGATSADSSPRDLRKFILTQPRLDYSALSPGQAATDLVRQTVHDLQLTPEHGVRVRLTGSVALDDEEFASIAQGTGLATALSGVLVFGLLLIALRSLRIVFPILLTLIVGLVTTTAFALLAVGSLNLISVAFAVMFIGIAVDFGIQFGVRYRDQHHLYPDHATALTNTARIIALPLAMAAGSTALGFLTFIPTEYRGVSELGLIAGAGMLIAFTLNITLLPALLTVTRPPAEPESVGYTWIAPLDRFLVTRRRTMLAIAATLILVGGIIMTQLRFDFDPLDLKDPHTESVSTLFDMMGDPDASPYTIDILRPSLGDASSLVSQLGSLPEVDHVMTLASFVPDDQEAKLALIHDTKTLLEPTFSLPHLPAPSESEVYDSTNKVIPVLQDIGAAHDSARALAAALELVVQRHDAGTLHRLQNNLIGVMQKQIGAMREMLEAKPVTVDTITDDLRRDWITTDGRALIEVYPKGNPRDHRALIAFTDAVRHLAPDATGAPISIQESGRTVTSAFIHAGIYAVIAIALLALIILRRIADVLRLLAPLILAGILTLATIVVIDLPLNFANIIALPLLLSLGVSYAIYFVSYWRAGTANPLQSSMARAVLFSASTVLVAFGSLTLSSHPGTSGMGKLLTLALLYCLLSTFVFLPSLLGTPKTDRQ